ncbi:glycoside hydrolase family 13 protein [Emericellopsis atlantica]|uniref:Glycoside hydrolase family 13 protein n=1 Tax=Emericellopsis atlantica TaxID=2614577 RepID=A0A9P7ZKW8_9HYPO|nr:glycoside hydrolase family 13 protein [Emericellopsis atlantica]KAG9253826.1 glycoside hydrolase family 13 protein [Emericellopsis atlantica]
MTVNGKVHVQKWWKHGVVYQIYPASFCDSNGDGVGDLPGITSKLDYLKDLGADIVWICPMYDSPQVDMGYDISNYEDVYRPYGTVQDMEHLIKEAHDRGIKIMLDLVINHTSDQHEWFKESRSSKDNPKRDWYIWKPAKYTEDGKRVPPNNWRSNFGDHSAWTWDETTQEYYLRLFAKEQPDVNFDCEEARKTIYKSAMEFWLERGVDGFRVDTVNMYSKPIGLPDAPIIDPDSPWQPAGHVYCNGPRMHEFLGEMNEILSRYGAITVGELPNTPSMEKVLKYVSAEAKQLDMVFQFDVVDVGHGVTHHYTAKPKNFELPEVKSAIDRTQTLIKGNDAWTTVFLENHDQARSVSRFADDSPRFREASAKMLALMQACLSGTQYVYQGQEIGVVNAPKDSYPLENYLDLNSYLYVDMIKERYGANNAAKIDEAFDSLQYLARDHSRVPMAWNGKGKYGGFADVAEKEGKDIKEPWMKAHPLAGEINVASQLGDSNSVLGFWKKMIAFRKQYADLTVYGDYYTLRLEDKDTFLFFKEIPGGNGDKLAVLLNFTKDEKKVEPPTARELRLPEESSLKFELIASTHGAKEVQEALAPFEGRAYLVKV